MPLSAQLSLGSREPKSPTLELVIPRLALWHSGCRPKSVTRYCYIKSVTRYRDGSLIMLDTNFHSGSVLGTNFHSGL